MEDNAYWEARISSDYSEIDKRNEKKDKCFQAFQVLTDNELLAAKLYAVAENTKDSIVALNKTSNNAKGILLKDAIPGYENLFDLAEIESYSKVVNDKTELFMGKAKEFGASVDGVKGEIGKIVKQLNEEISDYYEDISYCRGMMI